MTTKEVYPRESLNELDKNNATAFVYDRYHSICPEFVFPYRLNLTLDFFDDDNHKVTLKISHS